MTRIVVKLGGSLLENPELRQEALAAIASAWKSGVSLVVVHGGGKRIDTLLRQLGMPKMTHRGLRITDTPTLEVVVATLAGTVNKLIVSELTALGVSAAGISGADGETISATLHPPVDGVDLGHVGTVRTAHSTLIEGISGSGFLPVVASLGIGPDGALLNVNADSAASALAIALRAEALVFLTDVDGVRDADGAVMPVITPASVESLLANAVVTGGMEPKLRASVEAIAAGIGRVVIAGPSQHAAALMEGKGGTSLVAA